MRYVGFTLFYNPTRKNWQMSVQPEGEPGWLVNQVTEERAQKVFRVLEQECIGEKFEEHGYKHLAAAFKQYRAM